MTKNKEDFLKILEQKAEKVNPEWIEAGKKRFLSATEKKRTRILLAIMVGVFIADILAITILFLLLN